MAQSPALGDPFRLTVNCAVHPWRTFAGRAAQELTLLRTAQEAVGNARRHAGADRITVTVSWLGDTVILDVADDGRGFDPHHGTGLARDHGGFGLTSLAQRADDIRGTLTVDTAAGQGTTISLALPLDRRSPHDAQPSGTP